MGVSPVELGEAAGLSSSHLRSTAGIQRGSRRASLSLDGSCARSKEGGRPYVFVARDFLGGFGFGGLRRDQTQDILFVVLCARTVTFRFSGHAGSRDALVRAGTFPFCLRTCAPISLAAINFSYFFHCSANRF